VTQCWLPIIIALTNVNVAPFRFASVLGRIFIIRTALLFGVSNCRLQSAMSQEMASQPSDDVDSEPSPRSDDEMEDDEDINHYYNACDGEEHDHDRRKEDDPEYFEYQLLTVEDVERLLNESVEALSQSIKVINHSGIISCICF